MVLEPCIAAPACLRLSLPLLLGLASSRLVPLVRASASLSNGQAVRWSAMNAEKFGRRSGG
jgi:hypothetical protein